MYAYGFMGPEAEIGDIRYVPLDEFTVRCEEFDGYDWYLLELIEVDREPGAAESEPEHVEADTGVSIPDATTPQEIQPVVREPTQTDVLTPGIETLVVRAFWVTTYVVGYKVIAIPNSLPIQIPQYGQAFVYADITYQRSIVKNSAGKIVESGDYREVRREFGPDPVNALPAIPTSVQAWDISMTWNDPNYMDQLQRDIGQALADSSAWFAAERQAIFDEARSRPIYADTPSGLEKEAGIKPGNWTPSGSSPWGVQYM